MTKTELIFPAFSLTFVDFAVQFCFHYKFSFHEKPFESSLTVAWFFLTNHNSLLQQSNQWDCFILCRQQIKSNGFLLCLPKWAKAGFRVIQKDLKKKEKRWSCMFFYCNNNNNNNNNYFIYVSMSSSTLALIRDTFQARIGFWKCWFLRRGVNQSTQGKTSQSREENQQQTQPTWRRIRESNPGHIGGRRALLPLCHPCSPYV